MFLTKFQPANILVQISYCAPVAQLDRAADFESVGREFESPQARQAKPKQKPAVPPDI